MNKLKGSSPKNDQRLRLLSAYRGRGKRNNNLHLVYSPKTDRDWILPSDRQLIHWIYFLETNPNVKHFDLAPEKDLAHDDMEIRATELDAKVELKDGTIEYHEVKSQLPEELLQRRQLLAQSNMAAKMGVHYKIFTDIELQPHVKISMRWLKVINMAAALREQNHSRMSTQLINILSNLREGTVRQVIQNMDENSDPAVVLGLLAMFTIKSYVHIDIQLASFGYLTHWKWLGEAHHVEA